MPKDPYPQHSRLREVKDKTQFVYDFLTFLETKGYHLATADGRRGLSTPERDDFLYKFIEVDRWKLEDEKKMMLGQADKIPPKMEKKPR